MGKLLVMVELVDASLVGIVLLSTGMGEFVGAFVAVALGWLIGVYIPLLWVVLHELCKKVVRFLWH